MRGQWTIAWLALALAACTTDQQGSGARAGAGGLGGAGAGALAAGSGGSSGAAAGAAGVASAGTGGAAGTVASAGGEGAAGAGTAASGAIGGTSAGTGTGGEGGPVAEDAAIDAGAAGNGSAHVPTPSAGCGKSGRPSGGLVTLAGSHIYWFPTRYDGQAPMPLIMAYHAAGNGNDQLRDITQDSALAEHFVMAFPKSQGNGWSLDADSLGIEARFADLEQNYCIDMSRVFATGHSSGAQLIVQQQCRGDARYHAIAPVASSAYCPSWAHPTSALVIHGVDDKERAKTNQDADGRKDLAPYLSSNQCSTGTEPYEQAGCSSSGRQVEPGCVQYTGCARPTIWCQHDDPHYSMTNHGWPCFANAAIDQFFMTAM
jgi:polyhydroxybutyrate depolymerase